MPDGRARQIRSETAASAASAVFPTLDKREYPSAASDPPSTATRPTQLALRRAVGRPRSPRPVPVAQIPIARPLSLPNVDRRRERLPVVRRAPAAPWRIRAKMRTAALGAAPPSDEARAKPAVPAMNILRRPSRSSRAPATEIQGGKCKRVREHDPLLRAESDPKVAPDRGQGNSDCRQGGHR
jgi:hypothetical protein